MDFLKKILFCNTEDKPNKRSQSKPITKVSTKNHYDIAQCILSVLEKVNITYQENRMYLIPGEWFDKLKVYISNPGSDTDPYQIVNKYIVNRNVMVLVIYEVMKEILSYFSIDFIYYLDITEETNFEYDANDLPIINWKIIKQMSLETFKLIKIKRNLEDDTGKRIDHTFTYAKMLDESKPKQDIKISKIEVKPLTPVKQVSAKKEPVKVIDKSHNISETNVKLKYETITSSNKKENEKGTDKDNKKPADDKVERNKKDKNSSDIKSDSTMTNTINNKSYLFYHLQKMHLKPIGLYNGSVYCFMNTGMQCLSSIPELNSFFYEKEYKGLAKTKNLSYCESFSDFVDSYNSNKGSIKPPSSLFSACHSILQAGNQHDCQEFLRRYLGKIQDEINGKTKYNFDKVKNYYQAWSIYKEKNFSIIDQTFAGMFKSCVMCHKCKHVSETYDPFMDISLSFSSMRMKLSNMLVEYFKAEDINCEYKCDSCKRKTSITKYTEICVLPPVIVFHVKRFDGRYGKHNGSIEFKDTIEMKSFTSDDFDHQSKDSFDSTTKYELIAVAEHIGGSINSGHYIAYGRRNDKWYRFNDSSVSLSDEEEARSRSAYMIFYKRAI